MTYEKLSGIGGDKVIDHMGYALTEVIFSNFSCLAGIMMPLLIFPQAATGVLVLVHRAACIYEDHQ